MTDNETTCLKTLTPSPYLCYMKTIFLILICCFYIHTAEAQKYRFGAVSKNFNLSNDSGRIEIGDSVLTIMKYGKNKDEIVEVVNTYKIISKKDSLIEFRIGGGEKAFLSIKVWNGDAYEFAHTHALAWLSDGKTVVYFARRME